MRTLNIERRTLNIEGDEWRELWVLDVSQLQ